MPITQNDEYVITRANMATLIRQVFGIGVQVGMEIINPPDDPDGGEEVHEGGVMDMDNIVMLDALTRRRAA